MPFFSFANDGGSDFVGSLPSPVSAANKGSGTIPALSWDSGDTIDLVKTLGGIGAGIFTQVQRGNLQEDLIRSNNSGIVQVDPRTGQTSVATGAGTLNSGSAGFFGTNSSGQSTLFGVPVVIVFVAVVVLMLLRK